MALNTDLNRIRRDGWTVIEDVIPEDEVDAIRDHVLHSTGTHGRAKAAEQGIGHVPGFIRYDQSLASYLADARLMAILEALLGSFVKVSYGHSETPQLVILAPMMVVSPFLTKFLMRKSAGSMPISSACFSMASSEPNA